jgi:hypothetical protein
MMQGNSITTYGNISLSVKAEKDYAIVYVRGAEAYQLTNKETGEVSLVAFESKFAANRFFAENTGYFTSKII